MSHISMSQNDLSKYEVIKRSIRREITVQEAGELLCLSERHIYRLKYKVKEEGAKGIIHGGRGKPGNRKVPEKEQEEIKKLLRKHYSDFKPTFASEKLSERHRIKRNPKTIRRIMIAAGLWHPKQRKTKTQHRSWRERKSCCGEMEQFDGSYEKWFEDRGPECCLLASIDDATGQITKAVFADNEGVFPVFSFWKEYIQTNGKPASIYLDKFSTYKMNHKTAKENEDTQTQFERAAKELGIDLITAHSPQAKGRAERLFSTLQDRLIKELRLAGISNIKPADVFLNQVFIPRFNAKFAVEPKLETDLHVRLNKTKQKQLASIFSKHILRTVQNDYTLGFQNRFYQLTDDQPVLVCKKDKVIVEEHLTGEIKIRLRDKYLNFKELPERPKKKIQPWILKTSAVKKQPYRPPEDHPWRKSFQYEKSLTAFAKT